MSNPFENITICAIDCVTPHLAGRALQKSIKGCNFAESILFTSDTSANSHLWSNICIDPITSIEAYNKFILSNLHNFIQTKHVLIVQWDGYIVNHEIWRSNFEKYDYIGAVWPWFEDSYRVGNGGFSLRSKRLLKATSVLLDDNVADSPEDIWIGRLMRRKLESSFGIRFADEAAASRFSHERGSYTRTTFGFHGAFNLFRYCTEIEICELLDHLPPYKLMSREILELIDYCTLNSMTYPAHHLNKLLSTPGYSLNHNLAKV